MRHVVTEHDSPGQNPLSEAVFLILLSLAEGPRHGYAILKDVQGLSNNRVKLSTGTLYGALSRLLADGWIERFPEKEASRGRHAYRLTTTGRRVLSAEVTRLKSLARIASVRLAEGKA